MAKTAAGSKPPDFEASGSKYPTPSATTIMSITIAATTPSRYVNPSPILQQINLDIKRRTATIAGLNFGETTFADS